MTTNNMLAKIERQRKHFPHSGKFYNEKFVIYAIWNETTGKAYIGKSCRISNRIEQHFGSLRRNKHPNAKMQNDFNKGHKFFWLVLQDAVEGEQAAFTEQMWMLRLKTYEDSQGYNTKDTYFFRKSKDGTGYEAGPGLKGILQCRE